MLQVLAPKASFNICLVLVLLSAAQLQCAHNLGLVHASEAKQTTATARATATTDATASITSSSSSSSNSKRNAHRRRTVRNVHPPEFTSLMRANLEQSLKKPIQTTTVADVDVENSNHGDSTSSNRDSDSHLHGNHQSNRRMQQNSKTQGIRIKFITDPLEDVLKRFADRNTKLRGEAILNTILPQLASNFAKSLKVLPTATLSVPTDACFGYFTNYVDATMNDPGVINHDIVIFISAFDTLGNMQICSSDPKLSTLAVSSPCNVDRNDRPVVGFANICLNSLEISFGVVDQSSILVMEDVLSHELIHIFGMNSALFKYFRSAHDNSPLTPRQSGGLTGFFNKETYFNKKTFKCVNGRPDQELDEINSNTLVYKNEVVQMSRLSPQETQRGYYEIVLPTVAQVVRNQFDCKTLQGARLENQPTSEDDCMGSHFDERFFFTDIMSALYDDNGAYFSPLILAFLEDTGWYISNFERAENSPFGISKGCAFVTRPCIEDEKVPDHSKGFFCNHLDIEKITKCGPSHHYRGECDLSLSQFPERDYFGNSAGPIFTHADWCPIIRNDVTACDNQAAVKIDPIEIFHPESRCMNVKLKGGALSAVCIRATCHAPSRTLQFYIGTEKYNCTAADADKEKSVIFEGTGYTFLCPPLQHICPE